MTELSPTAGRAAAALLAELPPATRRTRVKGDLLGAISVLGRDVEGPTAHRRRRSTPVSPSG